MSCKKCKEKEDYTCGKKHNAKCIDYEGELHTNTEIEDCSKPDMEDVIEDINTELDFLHAQTDLTNLGSCETISYPGELEDLTIPEALITHETLLCELVAHTGYGEPEPCSGCEEDDCNGSVGECCEALIYISQLPNQIDITTVAGTPLITGSVFLAPGPPGTISKVTPVDLTIVEAGNYIVTADFTMEYVHPRPAGGSWVNTLYELRIGTTVVPYSTRHVKVDSGTPASALNTFTVTSKATNIVANSIMSLWVNIDSGGLIDADLTIISCTLTATKTR